MFKRMPPAFSTGKRSMHGNVLPEVIWDEERFWIDEKDFLLSL
jgi:hypothetical protein